MALILFAPLLISAIIIVRLFISSSIFFKQERGGLNGEVFEIIKLRSMTDERDEKGELLPDAQRLNTWGQFLRKTSLDELPELVNVLKGEMSFVGPRPLYSKYLDRYTPEQMRRHEAKPGITGWAQVNGRNALSWEEKFALDIWYVENLSFLLDLKIIFLTAGKVLKRKGINETGQATAQEFLGSQEGR